MKLNLFGGVFIFEGTYAEYSKLLDNVEKLGSKLVGIQTQLNRDTLQTQKDLVASDPNVTVRHQPDRQRPAGLQ